MAKSDQAKARNQEIESWPSSESRKRSGGISKPCLAAVAFKRTISSLLFDSQRCQKTISRNHLDLIAFYKFKNKCKKDCNKSYKIAKSFEKIYKIFLRKNKFLQKHLKKRFSKKYSTKNLFLKNFSTKSRYGLPGVDRGADPEVERQQQ